MPTYACSKCGVGVDISCSARGKPLVDDAIEKADGSDVQVCNRPEGHGTLESPMCCGQGSSCQLPG